MGILFARTGVLAFKESGKVEGVYRRCNCKSLNMYCLKSLFEGVLSENLVVNK